MQGTGRLDQPAGARLRLPAADVPPAEAYGVASFYALFALEPRPPVVAHVCADIACMCRGGAELVEELERTVGPAGAHPSNGTSIWLRAPASACASGAGGAGHARRRSTRRTRAIGSAPASPSGGGRAGRRRDARAVRSRGRCAAVKGELRLLRRVGHVDPTSLDSYRAAGGYAALRRAFELGPAGVIREVTDSKLLGRGGAAFPTGRKWEAVARNPVRPHYLVCNADESEPGTFKDRVVIEDDPFALIEAMTIAGLRDRLRARLPLPARRVPAGLGAADQRDRAGPRRAACSATT